MTISKKARISPYILTALFIIIAAAVLVAVPSGSAFAESANEEYTVRFYAGTRDDGVFYELEVSGAWVFPADIPQKEGYIFKGWTDASGSLSVYSAGSEYNALMTSDKEFFALWEKVPSKQTKPPMFSDTEKMLLLAGLALFMVLLTFVFYWFVTKKRTVKDLFRRKKKSD